MGDELAFQPADAKRYALVRHLGRGGMGDVFLVADRVLNRQVAVKVVRSDEVISRFTEEVGILGQLEHPNIVPLHDVGLTSGQLPYCTMRYVRGQVLAEVVRQLRSDDESTRLAFPLSRLMQIFLQIAQAVAYAHARGVVHRDLKPGKVMLGEHGEVQVLDWGLAKAIGIDPAENRSADGASTPPGPRLPFDDVTASASVSSSSVTQPPRIERDAVRSNPSAELTEIGAILGTPQYIAPEQAAGLPVDERADVWSLGVILYELLTLERPFTGPSLREVLLAVQSETPVPPHVRAPARNIPLELDGACMAALRREPAERTPSVTALAGRVQQWLETTADQEQRYWLAEGKVREGRECLTEYRHLRARIARLEPEVRQEATRHPGWRSVADKAELYRREDDLIASRASAERVAAAALSHLTAALEHDSAHAEGRTLLADYYWERLLDAEAHGDEPACRFLAKLVERHHGGRYARELRGDGALWLTSEPAGAAVELFQLSERGLRLIRGPGRKLGETPLGPIPLARGSYVAIVRMRGRREVVYPIHITRNREWRGEVRLFRHDEIPDDFAQIPAGPCVLGGDPRAGTSGPRLVRSLDEFCIARHPVTMAEYLAFLNDIDAGSADLHAPRGALGAPTFLVRTEAGFALPADAGAGSRWDPRRPVTGVSWLDAVAYCAWRSRRDGRPYRLPDEHEWEKAARGVDGRWFPWGDRFDHSLCNVRGSISAGPTMVAVDDFPGDESVYGVRGMAGNMRDWTATAGEGVASTGASADSTRVVRGGAWFVPVEVARAANRDWFPASLAGDTVASFRLAMTCPAAPRASETE